MNRSPIIYGKKNEKLKICALRAVSCKRRTAKRHAKSLFKTLHVINSSFTYNLYESHSDDD